MILAVHGRRMPMACAMEYRASAEMAAGIPSAGAIVVQVAPVEDFAVVARGCRRSRICAHAATPRRRPRVCCGTGPSASIESMYRSASVRVAGRNRRSGTPLLTAASRTISAVWSPSRRITNSSLP